MNECIFFLVFDLVKNNNTEYFLANCNVVLRLLLTSLNHTLCSLLCYRCSTHFRAGMHVHMFHWNVGQGVCQHCSTQSMQLNQYCCESDFSSPFLLHTHTAKYFRGDDILYGCLWAFLILRLIGSIAVHSHTNTHAICPHTSAQHQETHCFLRENRNKALELFVLTTGRPME